MILEDWVTLHVRTHMREYFQNLGYICDISIYGMRGGTYEILCHVDDLPKSSHVTLTRICDDCGKIDAVIYQNSQFKYCRSCSYKYNIDYKFKCIDCRKLLMRTPFKDEPRCKKCHRIFIELKNDEAEQTMLTKQDRLSKFWSDIK